MKTFYIKTKVFVGGDSTGYLKSLNNKKIWIICDGFLENSGGLDYVKGYINNTNRIEISTNVVPDPPLSSIAKGIAEMKNIKPEVIIALGGGSAIDTAKGIIYFAEKTGMAKTELFIAIPTTSGTGSEVTSVTVITDTENKVKYPIKDESIAPDIAILDPAFTLSVPHSITANTGIDVLTHALEAYVAQNATLCSDGMAEKAIHLIVEYLPKCCQELDNAYFREVLHNASTMAGMAFDIAGLGLNHAIAHQIGSIFHIPHGLANGMLIPEIIEFNSNNSLNACTKYSRLSRIIGIVNNLSPDYQAVNSLKKSFSQLLRQLKMPRTLREFGISKEEIMQNMDQIADQALTDICLTTNPAKVKHEDIIQIVKNII